MKLLRIFKWFLFHILETISGALVLYFAGLAVVDLERAKHLILVLLEIMQLPTPLWGATGLLVVVFFLLKRTTSCAFIAPKKPNLTKKTELQEKILNALKTETMPDWIAQNLGVDEQLVLRNLELLGLALLVARNGHGSSSWYLTEHGRAYLYP
jgi:hypothetical protein